LQVTDAAYRFKANRVQAAIVYGRQKDQTVRESFEHVRKVISGFSDEVSFTQVVFICNFADHLHENHLDIFAAGSELAKQFESLIGCMLGRGIPLQQLNKQPMCVQQSDINNVEFNTLQTFASDILTSSPRCHKTLKIHKSSGTRSRNRTGKKRSWGPGSRERHEVSLPSRNVEDPPAKRRRFLRQRSPKHANQKSNNANASWSLFLVDSQKNNESDEGC
jgi:hypothetical protein